MTLSAQSRAGVAIASGRDGDSKPSVTVPAAAGDWPQWRGNPQQTGYQSLAGRIKSPLEIASYEIGGALRHNAAMFTSHSIEGPLVVVSPLGSISAYRLDGTPVWSQASVQTALIGEYDFNDDGRYEVLAYSDGRAASRLKILSLDTGELLWSSPANDGVIGAVKAADLDADGSTDLVWAPAASSSIRAYSFAGGFTAVSPLWDITVADYMSDPYSWSPIVVGDADGDGDAEVVLTGGRRAVIAMVLNARTGEIESRHDYYGDNVPGRLVEGGGLGQLLQLADVDGNGSADIIVVSAYGSADQYMFQGLMTIRANDLAGALLDDRNPVGPRYAAGTVHDFDGDGTLDLLISQWQAETQSHILQLIDPTNLQVRTSIGGLLVKGVARTADDQPPVVLARTNTTEYGEPAPNIIALQWADGEFQTLWSALYMVPFFLTGEHDPRPVIENQGAEPLMFDFGGDGQRELLIRTDTGFGVVDILTGQTVASYQSPGGKPIPFIRPAGASANLFVMFADGTAALLDANLNTTGTLQVGGFVKLAATNSHGGEVAIVADANGDGINELYFTTAGGKVVRVTAPGETPPVELFQGRVPPQPVIAQGQESMLLKSCTALDTVCSLSPDGTIAWDTVLPYNGIPGIPVSINVGRRSVDGALNAFTSSSSGSRVHAIDVTTGDLLWTSDWGPNPDGSFAVFDFDDDGIEDAAFNGILGKGTVISGYDGSLLSYPVRLPPYGALGSVDYNGAPVVIERDGRGCILSVEDNAHVALLQPAAVAGAATQIVWAVPQANIDDERDSMPAVAPDSTLGAILGSGSKRGVFTARNVLTGEELWHVELAGGTAGTTENEHALGGVAALDVDHNGQVDFVVGSQDNFLYALNARTGAIVWSMNIGAPVGDPIAADVDGDGFSEIIVAAGDRMLHVVGTDVGPIPIDVIATATSSSTVHISWLPSARAARYEVARSSGEGFSVVGTTTSTAYSDTSAEPNRAYLYAVRGIDASDNPNPYSSSDLATTVMFTDDPLIPGTSLMKGVHLTEIRTAVAAVCELAGLPVQALTDSTLDAGTQAKATHINEQRTALTNCRNSLALPLVSFTDPSLDPGATLIRAAHFQELRDGVR